MKTWRRTGIDLRYCGRPGAQLRGKPGVAMTLTRARLERLLSERPELITHRRAARTCQVRATIIYRWVAAGLWPLPRAVCAKTWLFAAADVNQWLSTGLWPTGVCLRGEQRT